MEMIRAITLAWLFSGLRSDEIARLRIGCVRWQHDGMPIPGDSGEVLARDAVCLLDIPVHKTGTAFTKPVDPLLGKAIEAWQSIRPDQPKTPDRKTGEHVDFLFAHRAEAARQDLHQRRCHPLALPQGRRPGRRRPREHHEPPGPLHHRHPALQRQGAHDALRAAGLARAPVSPDTTQNYAKITPNTLSRAYSDAGYFERNVRTIEVLIDRAGSRERGRGLRGALAVL